MDFFGVRPKKSPRRCLRPHGVAKKLGPPRWRSAIARAPRLILGGIHPRSASTRKKYFWPPATAGQRLSEVDCVPEPSLTRVGLVTLTPLTRRVSRGQCRIKHLNSRTFPSGRLGTSTPSPSLVRCAQATRHAECTLEKRKLQEVTFPSGSLGAWDRGVKSPARRGSAASEDYFATQSMSKKLCVATSPRLGSCNKVEKLCIVI